MHEIHSGLSGFFSPLLNTFYTRFYANLINGIVAGCRSLMDRCTIKIFKQCAPFFPIRKPHPVTYDLPIPGIQFQQVSAVSWTLPVLLLICSRFYTKLLQFSANYKFWLKSLFLLILLVISFCNLRGLTRVTYKIAEALCRFNYMVCLLLPCYLFRYLFVSSHCLGLQARLLLITNSRGIMEIMRMECNGLWY